MILPRTRVVSVVRVIYCTENLNCAICRVSYWHFGQGIPDSVAPLYLYIQIQFLLKSKMFLINRHAQNWYWVWRRVFHTELRDNILRMWSFSYPTFLCLFSLLGVKAPSDSMLLVRILHFSWKRYNVLITSLPSAIDSSLIWFLIFFVFIQYVKTNNYSNIKFKPEMRTKTMH